MRSGGIDCPASTVNRRFNNKFCCGGILCCPVHSGVDIQRDYASSACVANMDSPPASTIDHSTWPTAVQEQ